VESVYSAVRTESLYKTDTLRLYRVNAGKRRVSEIKYPTGLVFFTPGLSNLQLVEDTQYVARETALLCRL
jgi:hypothetical protein